MSLPRFLLVGSFLSSHTAIRTVGEELAQRLQQAGWPVTVTSTKRARLSRLLDMQRTIWTTGPFAVAQVEVYSGAAFLWAEAACVSLKILRIPLVLTLHGGGLPDFGRRWPYRVRRLLSAAKAATVPSTYLLEAMQPYRQDLRLLPNAIDLECYSFVPRRQLQPHLIWLRAFHQIYQPEMAPEVLALVSEDYPSAHLTMIGPDKGDGSFEITRRRALTLGVADRLILTKGIPKSEVPLQLATGDIFLNTSRTDNTPISVMEAMACGLCVVSTSAGGLSHLLEEGKEALLVPSDSPRAMAAAVRRLLEEADLASRLSQCGRRKAESFDWSLVLPQWQDLLRECARA